MVVNHNILLVVVVLVFWQNNVALFSFCSEASPAFLWGISSDSQQTTSCCGQRKTICNGGTLHGALTTYSFITLLLLLCINTNSQVLHHVSVTMGNMTDMVTLLYNWICVSLVSPETLKAKHDRWHNNMQYFRTMLFLLFNTYIK